MSIASNRVSGSGIWGMTVDHTVMMIRDPDHHEIPWTPIPVSLTSDEMEVLVTSDEVVVLRPHA
ncbi:hypothetical protein LCGC14_2002800 [marine sediment metagenome]|uniref:Uncharacterized protein n=1 Tax=marine sediment metagenome TaxID=412755 RepID=A0A0F9FQE3_9ZZZZ